MAIRTVARSSDVPFQGVLQRSGFQKLSFDPTFDPLGECDATALFDHKYRRHPVNHIDWLYLRNSTILRQFHFEVAMVFDKRLYSMIFLRSGKYFRSAMWGVPNRQKNKGEEILLATQCGSPRSSKNKKGFTALIPFTRVKPKILCLSHD
jgi:hypothetical protein